MISFWKFIVLENIGAFRSSIDVFYIHLELIEITGEFAIDLGELVVHFFMIARRTKMYIYAFLQSE